MIKGKVLKKIEKGIKNAPGGSYGMYVKLSGRKGIKIFRGCYSSMNDANFKYALDQAKAEMYNLQIARRRMGIVPKCYGIKVFKLNNEFRVGIIMQHLGERRFDVSGREDWDTTYEKLTDLMRNVGIQNGDLHSGNVMLYRGRPYIIDFGAGYVTIDSDDD